MPRKRHRDDDSQRRRVIAFREMIGAADNSCRRTTRRVHRSEYRTLANLQRLAAFLQGFPGRKNIIWFTEKAPGVFLTGGETGISRTPAR